jgi:hypothetical protein
LNLRRRYDAKNYKKSGKKVAVSKKFLFQYLFFMRLPYKKQGTEQKTHQKRYKKTLVSERVMYRRNSRVTYPTVYSLPTGSATGDFVKWG